MMYRLHFDSARSKSAMEEVVESLLMCWNVHLIHSKLEAREEEALSPPLGSERRMRSIASKMDENAMASEWKGGEKGG